MFKTRPAILACAADGDFTVEVNGRTALKITGGRMLRYGDVAGHLKEGRNEVLPPPVAADASPVGGKGAIRSTFGGHPAWRVGSGIWAFRSI